MNVQFSVIYEVYTIVRLSILRRLVHSLPYVEAASWYRTIWITYSGLDGGSSKSACVRTEADHIKSPKRWYRVRQGHKEFS